MDISTVLPEIRSRANLSKTQLADMLGTSLASLVRWERGLGPPSPAQERKIAELYETVTKGGLVAPAEPGSFSSRGIRNHAPGQARLGAELSIVTLSKETKPPILTRLRNGRVFDVEGDLAISRLLAKHYAAAVTRSAPFEGSISAA